MTIKESLHVKLKHRLNPMHVYCRLWDILGNERWAGRITIWYEYRIWSWLKPQIQKLHKDGTEDW